MGIEAETNGLRLRQGLKQFQTMNKILIDTRQYMADGTEIHIFYTHGKLTDLGSTAAHLWITGQTDDKFFTPIVQPIGNDILGAINKLVKRVLEAEAKAKRDLICF